MYKGPQNHQVFPGDEFHLSCDQEVTLFGLIKGQKVHIFPMATTARRAVVAIPALVTQVEVKTAKSTNYTVVIKPNNDGAERLDASPIEIGIDQKRPPTLQEEMKRFITEEVSRQASNEGHETFEEADDFDLDQDEFQTAYTLLEMQEEEPIVQAPSEPTVDAPPDATLASKPEDTTPAKETEPPPATPAITTPIPVKP